MAAQLHTAAIKSIFNNSSEVADMGDHLATTDMSQNDMGQKVGRELLCPFCGGELGSHLTQSYLLDHSQYVRHGM